MGGHGKYPPPIPVHEISTPYKRPWIIALSIAVGGIFFYCDYRYIKLCADEMDMFREKSMMFGNWRERNARGKDPETLNP